MLTTVETTLRNGCPIVYLSRVELERQLTLLLIRRDRLLSRGGFRTATAIRYHCRTTDNTC